MTDTTQAVVVAAVVALTAFTGVALASPATTTTTTTDGQHNQTATVTFDDQRLDGESVTITSATLPEGGFAVVYNQSGAPIGHSEYLEPGTSENVTVSLDESVESSQILIVNLFRNDGSETYNASADTAAYETDSGGNVSSVARVYFEERDQNRNRSAEATSTTATTDETTAETTEAAVADRKTTDDSAGGVPGFTPIIAVVALLGAGLASARRS